MARLQAEEHTLIDFPGGQRTSDVGAVTLLLVVTLIAAWKLVVGGTVVSLDDLSYFYPSWSFLGENLRAGHIPLWNPFYLSGTPFAADPQSGWMYWPTMLLFSLFPMFLAAKVWIVLHLLIAGFGMYVLARVLGMRSLGSLVAATGYELSAMTYYQAVALPSDVSVEVWLPFLILAAELAIRSRTRIRVLASWGLAAFSLSQIFAAWIGQGSLYALLLFGSYVAYRTLVSPVDSSATVKERIINLVAHSAVVVVLGLGLSAAATLPRLEYNSLSNVAGGYAHTAGGFVKSSAVARHWQSQVWYNRRYPGA